MPQLLLSGIPIVECKGVLFDKDGTLVNSESYLVRLAELRIQESIKRFREKGSSLSRIERLDIQLSNSYGITSKSVNPNGVLAIGARHENLIVTAAIFSLFGESWPTSYSLASEIFSAVDRLMSRDPNQGEWRKLLPGSLRLLKELGQKGVTCGLISNDSRSGIQDFIEKNLLGGIFKASWSAEDHPRKPDPNSVQGLCKKLGLSPHECALVGDSETDLQMARKAKVGVTIGYKSGWQLSPNLFSHQYLIDHWDELTVKSTSKVINNI